ncbi:MAG: hypothetical protein WB542_02635, partial [Polaromonas sp.]
FHGILALVGAPLSENQINEDGVYDQKHASCQFEISNTNQCIVEFLRIKLPVDVKETDRIPTWSHEKIQQPASPDQKS